MTIARAIEDNQLPVTMDERSVPENARGWNDCDQKTVFAIGSDDGFLGHDLGACIDVQRLLEVRHCFVNTVEVGASEYSTMSRLLHSSSMTGVLVPSTFTLRSNDGCAVVAWNISYP